MNTIALEQLVELHRRELLLHCYRFMGSVTDATPPFEPPPPSRHGDVPWLQPYPDAIMPDVELGPDARYTAREGVELAFVAALQKLPPRQVAVLILCDVLGFPIAETALMLSTTPTSIKGLLQRGRKALARTQERPEVRPPAPNSHEEQKLVRRFADAFTADDVGGVVSLLTDTAWLAMPPAPHEYHTPSAIASFLQVSVAARGGEPLMLQSTRANGQPAFGCYIGVAPEQHPAGVIVLTLAGDHVQGITRFLDSEQVFPLFGLTVRD